MSAYDSSPVDSGAKEIRLARLHPSEWGGPIVLDTFVASLKSIPEYKALSYTWGSLDMSREIHVNGTPFKITENLASALHRIRSDAETIIIWIDLICINQEDLVEKASQVGLMGEIFRNTSEVLIWLGETYEYPRILEEKGTPVMELAWQQILNEIASQKPEFESPDDIATDALSMMRLFAQDVHFSDLPHLSIAVVDGQERLSYGMPWLKAIFNIRNLALASWWLRTWTVQETTLPPRQRILYGDDQIAWPDLLKAIRCMKRHFNTCCQKHCDRISDHWDILDDLSYKVLEVYKLDLLRSENPSLHNMVPRFRTRKATDLRDKIFAFLSLSRNRRDSIVFKPDYTMLTEHLYTRFAWHAIKDSECLDYLVGVDFQQKHQSCLDIPSWVPDWSVPISEERYDYQGGEDNPCDAYGASGDRKAEVQLLAERTLAARCIMADRVAAVTDVFHFPQAAEIIRRFLAFAGIDDHVSTAQSESPEYAMFWTTMFAGIVSVYSDEIQDWTVRRTDHADANLWELWCRETLGAADEQQPLSEAEPQRPPLPPHPVEADDGSAEKIRSVEVSVLTAAEDRRLFRTAAGRLGFGPRATDVGDEVCVLLGAHIPFVLRRADESVIVGDKAFDAHTVLGSCYVSDIMDGEAMQGNPELRDVYIV